MPVSIHELTSPPNGTAAEHELVPELTAELSTALEDAAGDEKKIRDAVFRFACRARAAAITPGTVAYVLGMSLADSPLALAERAAALGFFPRCDELAAKAEHRATDETSWWRCWRLDMWRPHDVGHHFI